MIDWLMHVFGVYGLYIGLAFTAGVVALIVWKVVKGTKDRAARAEADPQFQWTSSPTLVVIDTCPYSVTEVETAVRWLEQQGLDFGLVRVGDTTETSAPRLGHVYLDMHDQSTVDESHPGTARISWVDTDGDGPEVPIVKHAIIRFAPKREPKAGEPSDVMQLVLTHELAHMYWEQHVDTDGQVLSPTTPRLGWGTEGLRP